MKGLPPLARDPSPGILQGGCQTQALQRTQKPTGPWPPKETPDYILPEQMGKLRPASSHRKSWEKASRDHHSPSPQERFWLDRDHRY